MCIFYNLFCFFFNSLNFFFSKTFVPNQHPSEFCQRIVLFNIISFRLTAIKQMIVGIGMRMHPDTICLQNNRHRFFNRNSFCFGHRIHRIKNIFSVAMNNSQIFKSGKIICYFSLCSLIFFRNRNSISIILNNKNNR